MARLIAFVAEADAKVSSSIDRSRPAKPDNPSWRKRHFSSVLPPGAMLVVAIAPGLTIGLVLPSGRSCRYPGHGGEVAPTYRRCYRWAWRGDDSPLGPTLSPILQMASDLEAVLLVLRPVVQTRSVGSAAGGSDPFGWLWSRLSRGSAARCGRPEPNE
jgi:hypothetical protein